MRDSPLKRISTPKAKFHSNQSYLFPKNQFITMKRRDLPKISRFTLNGYGNIAVETYYLFHHSLDARMFGSTIK